ncbi:histidine phosphatase family protein [Thermomonospora umbrina]|uniref:Broad specificity phosphatase PhoE n=1 Tax=Thermomonospora umbrina TaxID=111806 RepID=A0A3D9SJ37_9ACTN|nr:histidine phosphatase family protein [Thermomonospora umbrina]REE95932.1 broad specificity phosphatase PhoE [Thermomonospora umbrina]
MPVIYLVRHAQASFGADDYDALSPLGREQATVLGRTLAARKPRDPLVVAGTLVRQQDTARILMQAAGLPGHPDSDARWNEYDFVDMVSRHAADHSPDDDPQAILERALRLWIQEDSPDGWRAFTQGAAAALADLRTTLGTGRDAVVVTSGGVIAALCGGLLGVPPSGVISLNRVTINASVTTVLAGSTGTTLLTFNDHAHFTGDDRGLLTYR